MMGEYQGFCVANEEKPCTYTPRGVSSCGEFRRRACVSRDQLSVRACRVVRRFHVVLLAAGLALVTGIASAASLTLAWDPIPGGGAFFKVERKVGTSGAFAQIATTAVDATTFVDSTVADGLTYCYRLRASNSAGDSDYSNQACGTVPGSQTGPVVTVQKTGTGSGSVTSSPAGIDCGGVCSASFGAGQVVTLAATPAGGSTFSGWTEGCSGTGSCVLTGNVQVRVTASFSGTTSGGTPSSGVTLGSSPAAAKPGTQVTATWSGIATPTATDWIGLFAAGAPAGSYLNWVYVSCTQSAGAARASGSCSLTIPTGLAPGKYELRLFAGNSSTLLAASGPITVSTVDLTASPATVEPGMPVTATWSGIASPTATDWIALSAAGAPAGSYLSWAYVSCTQSAGAARASGSCSLTIPAGVAPGTYELRLFASNSSTLLAASGPVTVSVVGLTASPSTASPGTPVTATWSGIATPTGTDWIALAAAGAPASSYFTWVYVNCTQSAGAARASGSCPLSIPTGLAAGTYELRLYAGNGSTLIAASGPVTVSAAVSLSASPSTASPGTPVTATWGGIATPTGTDWIGLFAAGAPAGSYLSWVYVNCTQSAGAARASGSCPLTIPTGLAPGTY